MKARFFGAVLLFAAAGMSAYGATIPFTFDTLSAGATDAQIQTYMQGVLNGIFGTNLVTVTVTGAVADQTYNGEGHVVGTGTGNTSGAKSLTLGTSTGATSNSSATPTNVGASPTYDTFIANTNDSSGNVSSQITMVFSGLTISAASFDYEIFPDGTCPVLNTSSCGALSGGHYANQPDLIFTAGTQGVALDPAVSTFGTSGTQWGVTPASAGSDGTATHSPSSGGSSAEVAPQYIGSISSASPLSLNNVTDLNFIDWPATIGIDNLKITYTQTKFSSPIPEPGSVLLLGTVLSGLFLATRKMRKA